MHGQTIFTPQGQRIAPALAAGAYQTYRLQAPAVTHFRPASCAEVRCEAYENGFRVAVDERTELGAEQARYIRRSSGRAFLESREGELGDGLTVFTFAPGQTCFRAADHRAPLEREPILTIHRGDWRGMQLLRRHTRPEFWVEDFAEHQDRLTAAIEKG
jgi:hypothetical protein